MSHRIAAVSPALAARSRCRAGRSRGVTLTELLAVMAIVAVMVGAAAPSMAAWIDGTRRVALAEEFVMHLQTARSEAIRRGTRVAMCKTADAEHCTSQGAWSQGWILFEDTDGDAQRDAGEPLVALRPALPEGWALTGNTPVADHVSYTALGVTQQVNGSFQAGTLTLCRAEDGPVQAVRVIVNSLGRPRTETTTVPSC